MFPAALLPLIFAQIAASVFQEAAALLTPPQKESRHDR